uniref:Uncharacterized protein n=1 Tax=Meloidogyne enterolobii TaxID=390850 RepID=A0A6V7WAA0_MELEN|nr:unnamed protein product [Meloidogyne enterolobii]
MRGQTKHAFYRQVLSVHALPCSSVLVRGRFKEEEKTDHERTRTDKTRTNTEGHDKQNTDAHGDTKHRRDRTDKTRTSTDGNRQTKHGQTRSENTRVLSVRVCVLCLSSHLNMPQEKEWN